jgi:DNA-binding MarR family transcriptional regulator
MMTDYQLIGPLLDLLARRLRAQGESEIAPLGLRSRHVVALTMLRDFGPLDQSQLRELLGIDPTSVVLLLNELEKDQLAERRRSPQDRRKHTVELTSEGSRKLANVETRMAIIEQELFSALDASELSRLYAMLQRAAAGSSGAREAPPASTYG